MLLRAFDPQEHKNRAAKMSEKIRFLIRKKLYFTLISSIGFSVENGKSKWGGKIPPNLKTPLRDGDVERPDDPVYKNTCFINATTDDRPGVVDRRRVPITDPTVVYSGCYIRASINMYPFNSNGNRGVACGLQNVQFWDDGDPLNGRLRAEDEFDALDVDDDEDFLS